MLVPDYEAGLDFYVGRLEFELVEDTALERGKRWLVLRPGTGGAAILLARAVGKEREAIGRQGGGRVWLFLETDDFERDHRRFTDAGVVFEEEPRDEPYGRVAVFRDPFGNRWDMIEPSDF